MKKENHSGRIVFKKKKNAHKVPAHQGESSILALHPDYTPGSAET